jgi:hypothetical protein
VASMSHLVAKFTNMIWTDRGRIRMGIDERVRKGGRWVA